MLPLFKSHYSIGKSILTLDEPSETLDTDDGATSIFSLCQSEDLKQVCLVEDSPAGFLQARKVSMSHDIHLIFGLRLKIQSTVITDGANGVHKIILFALNDNGIKLLNKIYSRTYSGGHSTSSYKMIEDHWDESSLMLAVPFYDSFLYENSFSFSSCIPNFSFTSPIFFLEQNNLPTDFTLRDVVKKFANDSGFDTFEAKSVYYHRRSDVEAFQTYKCLCSRNMGRKSTLSKPNLDGFGSKEFSFESWLENK